MTDKGFSFPFIFRSRAVKLNIADKLLLIVYFTAESWVECFITVLKARKMHKSLIPHRYLWLVFSRVILVSAFTLTENIFYKKSDTNNPSKYD